MPDRELVRYYTVVEDSARWNGFRFRDDDIVISTPPKCGTTWTQMMCALLIFQTPTFDRSLDLISPWLDMLTRPLDRVVADLDAETHRRFIKTHTPLDGLPFDEHVTYICVGRDPRDVASVLGQPHRQQRHGRVHQRTRSRGGARRPRRASRERSLRTAARRPP